MNLVTKAHHMMGVAFIVFPLASAPAADAFQSTGDRSAVHDIRKRSGDAEADRQTGKDREQNDRNRRTAR